jgi:hypothetical protein
MKTAKPENEEMRSHYNRKDLGKGVRGKYYADYQTSHNLVRLKPEVAQAFPSEEAVNEALMALIKIAQLSTSKPL